MFSVVMAGRNDDYGYKPKHRLELALYMWARELGEGEEIIFVDDNTDPEKPTLPEEIARRLSPEVKKLIRILRISPETHEEMNVTIPMAEYHAKNVGIRNARNEWIIATNTDVFPIGFPRSVRFPKGHLIQVTNVIHIPTVDWIECRHTDELFYVATSIRERGIWKPGDFQMMHRSLWSQLRGYDEDLKDWGYNDSLLTQKAGRVCSIGSIGTHVYHLNHKTAKTPARGWEHLKSADMPDISTRMETTNGPDWGLWKHEEVRL